MRDEETRLGFDHEEQHHPSTVVVGKSTTTSNDFLHSSITSIAKMITVLSLIMALIFTIYYLIPSSMGWFTPLNKGGNCRGCNSVIQESEEQFYNPTFRRSCSCDCWDGRSKGPYGRGTFKYIYYQIEPMTLWLVFVSILMVVSFYQSVMNVFNLMLGGNCNYLLLPIYGVGWYGVYYSYGAHFNYFNDDSHALSWHQFYFTISETFMLYITATLLDKNLTRTTFSNPSERDVKSNMAIVCKSKALGICLWLVLSTSLTHIAQLVHDQGLSQWGNLIFLRDLFFVLTDLPYVVMCVYLLRIYKIFQRPIFSNSEKAKQFEEFCKNTKRNLLFVGISVVVMVFFLSRITFGG